MLIIAGLLAGLVVPLTVRVVDISGDTSSVGLSLNSLGLLSPEVVDGVAVQGEGKELKADVEHLELDINPGEVNHLLEAGAFIAPSSSILVVVMQLVGSVEAIIEECNDLSDDHKEDTHELPNDKAVGDVMEDDENPGLREEGGSPEEASNEPDRVLEQDTEEVDRAPHVVLSNKAETVVLAHNVLSVEQVRVEGHVCHDKEPVQTPSVPANLLSSPSASKVSRLDVVEVNFRQDHAL